MASSSLHVPELIFLSPRLPAETGVSLHGSCLFKISWGKKHRCALVLPPRINAVQEQGFSAEHRELLVNGNGAATNTSFDYRYNGSLNGTASVIETENEATNGNGAPAKLADEEAKEAVEEVAVLELNEDDRKKRIEEIGEDLLAIAADQPFRFPATFTFVVRAFSVLDGIGKGLDPRFDNTEIAKPYALELLKFREAGVEVILKVFRTRWDRQYCAFYNLFRQADRVEKLAEIIQRLEQGDLKLRVRTLESERAFQRLATSQKTLGNVIAAGSLVNLATIFYVNSSRVPAVVAYSLCAFLGLQILFGSIKAKKLDEQEKLITGTA